MNAERPGDLNPGADMAGLAASIEELHRRFDLLTSASSAQLDQFSKFNYETNAFVVMPFGPEDLQIVYEDYVKPTIEDSCSLRCLRGDDMFGSESFMDDILQAIDCAEIVIADLTGQNANVFYEVGIAHAMKKPVLLMAQSIEDVPSDLRHRRVLIYDYSPRGCKRLEGRLKDHVLEMIKSQNMSDGLS